MKHQQPLRRGLGVLLSVLMSLSLLPATALAASPVFTICGTTPVEGTDYAPDASGGIVAKTDKTDYLTYSGGVLTVTGDVTVTDTGSSVLELTSGDLTINCTEGSSLTLDGTTDVCLLHSTLTLIGAGDVTINASDNITVSGDRGNIAVEGVGVATLTAKDYSGDLTISTGDSNSYFVAVNNTTLNLDTTGNISITGAMPITKAMTVTNAADVTVTDSVGNILASNTSITATGNVSIESTTGMVVNGLTVNGAKNFTLTGNVNGIIAMGLTIKNCDSWSIINKNQETTSPWVVGTFIVDETTYNGTCYGVTVTDDGNGTASASPAVAPSGTAITLSAKPKSGYSFKEWQVVSGDVTIEDNQFTMPGKNVAVKALFEAAPISSTDVTIDETTFPDAKFRAIISADAIDADSSGSLSAEEIAAVQNLSISYKQISDLTGIEHFTELTELYCMENQLTELDVSKNTKLSTLCWDDNQLESLNVSKNTALTQMACSANKLTELDVSKNTSLTEMACSANKLTELDVSKNTSLTILMCGGNELESLDVSNNTALTKLTCDEASLTELNVSKNTKLTELNCARNQLTSLDLSKNTKLTELNCEQNQLTSLDLSKNTALGLLNCEQNQLTSLDLSNTTLSNYNFTADLNQYAITLDNGTFDLSTLPGKFDASKANNWVGGTVKNGILTVNDGATEVTYGYDCGRNLTANFSLTTDGGADAGIAVDAENFPDKAFRTYVSTNIDENGDKKLSESEIAQVTNIDVKNTSGLKDLTGIAYFTNLETLDCSNNQLISLDLSSNDALTTLKAENNSREVGLKKGTLDLNSLIGFDVNKASSWVGGTVKDGILTVNNGATKVTYDYDCGQSQTVTFQFSCKELEMHTVTAYGLYETHTPGFVPGTTMTFDAAVGENVSLLIGMRDGYTMKDVTLVGIAEEDLTWAGKETEHEYRRFEFTMPANDVTVTVNWIQNGSSGGSGNGSGSGSVTVPVSGNQNTTHVQADVSGSTATVQAVDLSNLGSTDTVEIDFSGLDNPIETANLPASVVENAVSANGGTDFKGGYATVSLPHTLSAGQDPAGVVVYYLDDNGNIEPCETMYDVRSQSVIFTTSHFSVYFVGYEQPEDVGTAFTDVPSGAYYETAIQWAVEKGITSGTTATTFSPNAACTRAQAVTFLWRAAGFPAPRSSENPFTDVDEDSYYYDAVLWAVENGITSGTTDTTFSPDTTCTRAQIVTFLWRSQGAPAIETGNPFTDVAADAYYTNAVLWAAEKGVTSGTGATAFSPSSKCTRAQIATLLFRYLEM